MKEILKKLQIKLEIRGAISRKLVVHEKSFWNVYSNDSNGEGIDIALLYEMN